MSKAADEASREFRVIFEAHYDAVRAYARRRCARLEDADDVVSETFTVAWRRLRDIPPGSELPWLYGVARRVLANQRRSERRLTGLHARSPTTWRRCENATMPSTASC